jgi:hypothetical protein
VASAMRVSLPVPDDLPVEDILPSLLILHSHWNYRYCRNGVTKAMIHTAAASHLGQMIVKLALTEGRS